MTTRPQFREGAEWRRLTATERGSGPWKYVLLRDVFFEVETGVTRHYDALDGQQRKWMMILPHGITVRRGYAWNGNTSAPDSICGVSTLLGSVPHDALFQFSGAPGYPRHHVTLWFANRLYYSLTPYAFGWLYLSGLTLASWALWGRKPKNGEHVASYPLHLPEPT